MAGAVPSGLAGRVSGAPDLLTAPTNKSVDPRARGGAVPPAWRPPRPPSRSILARAGAFLRRGARPCRRWPWRCSGAWESGGNFYPLVFPWMLAFDRDRRHAPSSSCYTTPRGSSFDRRGRACAGIRRFAASSRVLVSVCGSPIGGPCRCDAISPFFNFAHFAATMESWLGDRCLPCGDSQPD
jgi:hypothetical protein